MPPSTYPCAANAVPFSKILSKARRSASVLLAINGTTSLVVGGHAASGLGGSPPGIVHQTRSGPTIGDPGLPFLDFKMS